MRFGRFPARRLGFTTAAVVSVSAFGFSLAGIAGLDEDLRSAERDAVRVEEPVRSSDDVRSEKGPRHEDCPWRERRARARS